MAESKRRRFAGSARGVFASSFAVGFVALVASCSSNVTPAHLTQGCAINSDCESPYVCAFQICHQQCSSSRDCPSAELCVIAMQPHAVCQLPSEMSCSYNSDCVSGEICAVDARCRDQCAADRDCLSGQVCASGACASPTDVSAAGTLIPVATDGGSGVQCQLNSDCGDAGLVCREGYCAVQCKADIDCVQPQGPGGVCVAGRCEAASADVAKDAGAGAVSDAGAGTVKDAGVGLPAGYGQVCNLPSDCPAPLKCGSAGQCTYQCNVASDCSPSPQCCVAHECTTGEACDHADADAGGTGAGSADGGADAGACKPCVSNSACDDGLYCNGEEQCYAGCCAPALDTPCDSHSPCIVDSCDETAHKCSSVVVAAQDGDGDGHLAFGCAGGDDCDDSDPTVYTGHAEVFDGKDNDCNGLIDDWTSEPKGAISGALSLDSAAALYGAPIQGGSGGWLIANELSGGSVANSTWHVAPVDGQWKAGPVVASVLSRSDNPFYAIDAASGPDSSCFLNNGASQAQAIVVDAGGALVGQVTLGHWAAANLTGAVTWTGSEYLIGWNDGGTGTFALLDSSANLLGTHALPSGVDGNIGVAANGTSLAVAYERNDTELVELAIFNLSGGLGGTADLSLANYASVVMLAVAAVPNGYVVLWAHDHSTLATYVPALNGKPGTPREFLADPSYTEPTFAKGASDGVGAAFLIQYPAGVSFGYLNGSLKNPFELTGVAPGGAVADIAGGQGGRLGLFYTQNGQFFGRQAGYASLSGADCAAASDCASGVCKAIVAAGPTARSACQ